MRKVEAVADSKHRSDAIEVFNPAPMGSVIFPELPESDRRAALISTAVKSGFWVTNPTADGLVLMVPVGGAALPLVNEDGERFGVDFLQATRFAAGAATVPR